MDQNLDMDSMDSQKHTKKNKQKHQLPGFQHMSDPSESMFCNVCTFLSAGKMEYCQAVEACRSRSSFFGVWKQNLNFLVAILIIIFIVFFIQIYIHVNKCMYVLYLQFDFQQLLVFWMWYCVSTIETSDRMPQRAKISTTLPLIPRCLGCRQLQWKTWNENDKMTSKDVRKKQITSS